MATTTMARVFAEATIQNIEDEWAVKRRLLAPEQARRIVVPDALVDTGATFLALPTKYIKQLGLTPVGKRRIRTTTGVRDATIYEAVRLAILGRGCLASVSEVPDDCPVLIGQLALEELDWVVDTRNQRLIGNPEHGGEWMGDEFQATPTKRASGGA